MYFVPPHNCINKLFSEENKVPEHCLKLERWQGPPRQQSKTVWNCVVLYDHFVYSVMKTKSVIEDLLIQTSSLKITKCTFKW